MDKIKEFIFKAVGKKGTSVDNISEKLGVQPYEIYGVVELFGLNRYKVNSGNIGFAIAPCINAAGRLDTPEYALKLLLSDCDSDAKYYGEKIFNLNEKRKEIQKNISDNLIVDDNTECIMIAMKENITGIAGILASRIKEKYLKPTFIFHDDGENLGGSARTFGEFPIIDCLNGNKDLILEVLEFSLWLRGLGT